MKDKIFSLDLGNQTLKLLVVEEDENGQINILTKLNKNIESFSNGEIIDENNFLEEVIIPIKELAEQLYISLNNIILSYNASYFSFHRTKSKVAVSEKYVSENDIKKCFLIAKASLASGNYETLYEEAISYYLDGSPAKIRDPLGAEARTLEIDFCIIQALKASLNKIKDFFAKNDIVIDYILPNPIASSYVLFPKKDKELGVIIVDFGYRLFNVSVFVDGKLTFYQNIDFGLGNLIEDLAIDLGVEVKQVFEFMINISNYKDKKQKIGNKLGKERFNYHSFAKILEKKFFFYWKKHNLSQLFLKLKENYRLPSGIYLIGGGSFIPEIETSLKKYSGYLVKKNSDIYNILNKDELIYLNALGLVYFFEHNIPRKSFINRLVGFFKNFFV